MSGDCSRIDTEESNAVWVPSEGRDVLLHPRQSEGLIFQSQIPLADRRFDMVDFVDHLEKAKDAKTEVKTDEDDVMVEEFGRRVNISRFVLE
jgi:hypothetical protein